MEKSQILTCCYMVQRGKPAAVIPVPERDINKVIALVNCESSLKAYIEPLADGWVSLWIYKYPHILDVIKTVPQAPESAFDHWVLGKLFGYEEAAIQEFLSVTVS